ncbi:phosphoethanolamine transferase [Vibrio europaeus]|uniref:phosphoethanolamine transferase n=1 Tax=Vibrio europaeus TaxID=300876 RepID=UPI00233E82F9|nr:phosphoethanolamine--lipid A transferase [Vibrio europaeus]MDC5856326.1 phosphoethanolamine--lipid A transferase [Vibrio europaeus]
MKAHNSGISYVLFTLLLSGYFTFVVNIPFYKELELIFARMDSVEIGFVASIPILLWAILNFLFNLFSWPIITKPFFILLLICSSIVSYAGYNYGAIFDQSMMANLIETNSSEASSYISSYSVLWIALMGILPALVVWRVKLTANPSKWKFVLSKLASMTGSLLIFLVVAALYYQNYASVGRNNSHLQKVLIPSEFVYSFTDYTKQKYFSTPVEYRQLGTDAKQSQLALSSVNSKPTLVVFVVGETARTQNYHLNGYERQTSPFTEQQDVTSFQDVSSCGTATAVSVPCMFSNMTRGNFDRDRADNQDNAIDIVKRAGVDVLWLENNGGDKEVAKNVIKRVLDSKLDSNFCNGSSCYDMALLSQFDEDVASLKGNRLIALHLIGSHGPTYFQRYPQEMGVFQPDCQRADIENCSHEQLVNTYDNTIRYTDFVLSQTIEHLKSLQDRYNTALLYVSDHGESLGEDGVYLHGLPYSFAPLYQTRVPMLFWASKGFRQQKHLNIDCLQQEATRKERYSHDNIFHSILGIMDVETQEYDSKLDIFGRCRV